MHLFSFFRSVLCLPRTPGFWPAAPPALFPGLGEVDHGPGGPARLLRLQGGELVQRNGEGGSDAETSPTYTYGNDDSIRQYCWDVLTLKFCMHMQSRTNIGPPRQRSVVFTILTGIIVLVKYWSPPLAYSFTVRLSTTLRSFYLQF